MADWVLIAISVLTAVAALLSGLAFLAARRSEAGLPGLVTSALRDHFQQSHAATVAGWGALGQALEARIGSLEAAVDSRVQRIDDRVGCLAAKLDKDIAAMGEEATRNRDGLRQLVEARLADFSSTQATLAKDLREELGAGFHRLTTNSTTTLNEIGANQKERLDKVSDALRGLTDKHEKGQEQLRQTVEARLETIRQENQAKLEEMRRTVDEKLQSTLDTRLGESFNRVVEQLERVHQGIGEMQTLAVGVGDLKRVLSNVTARGAFGEVQLAALLDQFLSPEQLVRNATVKDGSLERVEFAVKLPGRDNDGPTLLPIDAKFPQEDYERLLAAAASGDTEAVADSGKALELRIRAFAKTIRAKYISPPRTTDFALLFLPTEGLFAEVLRRPGLFEQLQRECHVVLTGPTTLTAFLNALQMGFRSLAIEKRSSEVWQILGAVRTEFGRYNDVVDRLSKQLGTAAKSVEALGTRARAMTRKLRDVEILPDGTAQEVLGFNGGAEIDEDEFAGQGGSDPNQLCLIPTDAEDPLLQSAAA